MEPLRALGIPRNTSPLQPSPILSLSKRLRVWSPLVRGLRYSGQAQPTHLLAIPAHFPHKGGNKPGGTSGLIVQGPTAQR